jgi:hypothetical protein
LIPYVVSINCGGAEAGIHIQMWNCVFDIYEFQIFHSEVKYD